MFAPLRWHAGRSAEVNKNVHNRVTSSFSDEYDDFESSSQQKLAQTDLRYIGG